MTAALAAEGLHPGVVSHSFAESIVQWNRSPPDNVGKGTRGFCRDQIMSKVDVRARERYLKACEHFCTEPLLPLLL
jgi:hypothetical protein